MFIELWECHMAVSENWVPFDFEISASRQLKVKPRVKDSDQGSNNVSFMHLAPCILHLAPPLPCRLFLQIMGVPFWELKFCPQRPCPTLLSRHSSKDWGNHGKPQPGQRRVIFTETQQWTSLGTQIHTPKQTAPRGSTERSPIQILSGPNVA